MLRQQLKPFNIEPLLSFNLHRRKHGDMDATKTQKLDARRLHLLKWNHFSVQAKPIVAQNSGSSGAPAYLKARIFSRTILTVYLFIFKS